MRPLRMGTKLHSPFLYRLWNSDGDIRWRFWANEIVAYRMGRKFK